MTRHDEETRKKNTRTALIIFGVVLALAVMGVVVVFVLLETGPATY